MGESPYFKELAHRFRGLARSESAGRAGRWGPGGCSPLFWEAPLFPEGRPLAGEATRPRRTTGFVQPLPVSSTTSRKSPESTQMCGPAGAGPAAGQWPRRGARGRELLARLALPLQPQFPCRAGRPPSAHGASVPAVPALRRPWGSPGSPAPVLMAPGGKLQREALAATANLSVSDGGCQSRRHSRWPHGGRPLPPPGGHVSEAPGLWCPWGSVLPLPWALHVLVPLPGPGPGSGKFSLIAPSEGRGRRRGKGLGWGKGCPWKPTCPGARGVRAWGPAGEW